MLTAIRLLPVRARQPGEMLGVTCCILCRLPRPYRLRSYCALSKAVASVRKSATPSAGGI
jgi:hypothetical protein